MFQDMPQPQATASHSDLLPYHTILKRNATKSSVIGIAATATVLTVILICGLLFWFTRRRKKGRNRSRNGDADSVDGDSSALQDRSSKTPLMRVENQSQASHQQGNSAPQYPEDDDVSFVAPNIPRRTPSGASTIRSLPPSYDIAVRASPALGSRHSDEDIASHGMHRSSSSASRSGHLRPLMLVAAQQSSSGNREQNEDRGRSRSPSLKVGADESALSIPAQRPAVRPRASSRFHEEDLDI